MGEIRRTRTLLGMRISSLQKLIVIDRYCLANNANADWINGEKTEDIVAFLDKLYTAKRRVEKQIVVLGGEADSVAIYDILWRTLQLT